MESMHAEVVLSPLSCGTLPPPKGQDLTCFSWANQQPECKATGHALDRVQQGRERWAGRAVSMRVDEAACPACGEHTSHLHPFAY